MAPSRFPLRFSLRPTLIAVGLAVPLGLSPRAAQATPDVVVAEYVEGSTRRADSSLLIEVGTRLPISVGGRLQLRLPERLHIGVGLGLVPRPYLDATVSAVAEIAGLGADAGDLISRGVDGGILGEVFVGWSPWPHESLYLQLAYTVVDLSGRLDGADVAALDVELPAEATGGATLEAGALLHAIEGEVGFRWEVDGLRFRLSLGLLATLAAETEVRLEVATGEAVAEIAATDLEQSAQRSLLSYAFVPTLGLGVGYDIGL